MRKILIYIFTTMLMMAIVAVNPSVVRANDTYTDSETGVSFTIPEGWKRIGLSNDERQIAKERFATEDGGAVLVFGSVDVYSTLTEEERKQYPSNPFIGYRMTDNDAADMLKEYGDAYDSYKTETIGGVQWYIFEGTLTDHYTQFINGNMIFFTTSKLDDDRYKQIKEVIVEVSQKELEKEETILKTSSNADSEQIDSPSSTSVQKETNNLLIWSLVFIVAIIIYAVIRSKKNNHKEIVCSDCGTTNEPGSKYCSKCGKPLK